MTEEWGAPAPSRTAETTPPPEPKVELNILVNGVPLELAWLDQSLRRIEELLDQIKQRL